MSKNIVKIIFSVFASNISGIIFGFITGIIFSRTLGAEGRGLYATVLVIPGLFASFALLGSRQSTIFHIGQKSFSDKDTLSALYIIFIVTSLFTILLSAIAYYIINNADIELIFIIIALITIPTRLLVIYCGGFFIGKEKFNFSNILIWMPEFLNLIFVSAFVLFRELTIEGALFSYLLSNFITGIYGIYYLQKSTPIIFKIKINIIISIVKLGLIYALAIFVMQLNYRLDILILEHYWNTTEIGIYSLGVAFATQLWQIPNAIALVINTKVANSSNPETLKHSIARLIRLSIIVCLFLSAVMYFIAPWIIPFLYGTEFIRSVAVLQAILPGILMFVVFRIISGTFSGTGHPEIIIMIFVPALIINLALNFIWIPHYGGIGAAWATNVSYSLGAIATLLVFSKKMNLPLNNIFRFAKNDFIIKRNANQEN